MRFDAIEAVPHPRGNRIRLSWSFPSSTEFPGVRVVRREGTHPTAPDDGAIVADGVGISEALDDGLKGETVYYYTLFGYRGDPREYDFDWQNRIESLATAPHDNAGQMYALLPAIYHRYDTRLPEGAPPEMPESEQRHGQLRRFLGILGGELDVVESFAKAALHLNDVRRTHGRLLPLLASWIAWRTDRRVEIETQRNEIRQAPFVYRTVGLKPTIEATVKRVSNWESRTKEFVHNVFRSNSPARLNLWLKRADGADWSAPAELFSLDSAYEGRPAFVRDALGTLWLFYHTRRHRGSQIWFKTHDALNGWAPSRPLFAASRTDNKHPTAALSGGTPWVFWSELDAATQSPRLVSSVWDGTAWSTPEPLPFVVNRPRKPQAFADGAGNVWLFWLEPFGVLRYARHDGVAWGAPLTFPLDAGNEPRVEGDPFVAFDAAGSRIWVLWARDVSIAAGQTRREIAYRVKGDENFDVANWGGVNTLPRPPAADYHDREPSGAFVAGSFELVWASNRDAAGYAVFRSVLLDEATNSWGLAERLSAGAYAARDPLPVPVPGGSFLVYRSNQSLEYPSALYAATVSTDFRYAGSSVVDTRDAPKAALRGAFDDFGAYTYDAGTSGQRDDDDWYARDTIGLYLSADTLDSDQLEAGRRRIRGVLGEFMPITDRAVFVTATDHHDDYVYTYGVPSAEPAFVTEGYGDLFTSEFSEALLGPNDGFADALE